MSMKLLLVVFISHSRSKKLPQHDYYPDVFMQFLEDAAVARFRDPCIWVTSLRKKMNTLMNNARGKDRWKQWLTDKEMLVRKQMKIESDLKAAQEREAVSNSFITIFQSAQLQRYLLMSAPSGFNMCL